MAVQQMRNARFLRRRRTRGDDAQIAIHLHGVGIDDAAAELFRQGQRQRRLAAGGRPCDKHRPFRWCPAGHPMTFVATLISNPAAPALDAAALERARAALPAPQAPLWLDPGIAADIPFNAAQHNSQAIDVRAVADRVRAALADAPVDAVVQPAGGRRKALFLADMDSTMIGQECIDELADLRRRQAACRRHHRAGHARGNRVRACPARARRAAPGLAASAVDEVIDERIRLTPGARDPGRHAAKERRLYLSRDRRLHAVHAAHRGHHRFRREPRQHARRRCRWPPDRRGGGADLRA